MLEKEIERKIAAYCAAQDIYQQKLTGRRGCCDRIYFLPYGGVVVIEYKQQGKKAEPLQKHNHTILKARHHHVYVCDNFDDAIFILNFWRRHYRCYFSLKKYEEGTAELEKQLQRDNKK